VRLFSADVHAPTSLLTSAVSRSVRTKTEIDDAHLLTNLAVLLNNAVYQRW